MYETVPVRITRESLAVLRRLKARKMFEESRKVTDAEVIADALSASEHATRAAEKTDFLASAGFYSSGKRRNATKELDDVVYGRDD